MAATQEETVRLVIGAILMAFTLFISYPLFIYSWYALWTHRAKRYFVLRGVTLLTIESAVMFISICVAIPIKVCVEDLQLLHMSPLALRIIDTLDVSLILAVFVILCIKIWCLNFSHQLQLDVVDAAWKARLETLAFKKESFYRKYQHSLGSLSFLVRAASVVYVALCGVAFAFEFVATNSGFTGTTD